MGKKMPFVCITAFCMLLLSGCASLNDSGWITHHDTIWARPAPIITVVDTGATLPLTPGIFSGVGTDGWSGDIRVEVEVDGAGRIARIDVTEHSETPSFAAPAFEQITAAVLASQSTGVDIVAGSTVTSTAFIEGIENALLQAGVSLEQLRSGGAEATSDLSFMPGTFVGVGADGWNGEVHVAVTFSATAITDVEVVHHQETQSFADIAFGQLIPDVLRVQSANLDTVAGATRTADAFIVAVADAINQSVAGAPAPPPPAPEPTPEPTPSPEPTPEPAAPIDPAEPGEARFAAGTYRAWAMGYVDSIAVSVEFDEYRIVEITVTSHEETPAFFNMVVPDILNSIIEAQSTEVSNISGATATSQAIREAVDSAIEQAAN